MAGKINENIKGIRELKNYTQQYMAAMLGMTQAGYSKMEKGTSRVSFDKLQEIAAVFEMDIQTVIMFESSLYLQNRMAGNDASQQPGPPNIHSLYRDKIMLLEKLLELTDSELRVYKAKYGGL